MDLKQDYQISFVQALKAVDSMKDGYLVMDYEKEYRKALRDLAETMFDMTDEDFENNEVEPTNNAD